ncbi:MAG: hypothetical protein A4E64_02848 [Syntrophorhabdus sp. PtaU1.Bin058]|nr:MAG: hypothetical protein A4E64_02848 [Syntrophorhabdus sp. PtaU1.Bin058]
MGKKVHLIFAVLVLIILPAFLTVDSAGAFCVYNKTDTKIYVHQTGGQKTGFLDRGFEAELNPGDNGCCNWQDTDCNKSGDREGIVTFNVGPYTWWICENFPIKAGGWLTVEGSAGNYKCVAH